MPFLRVKHFAFPRCPCGATRGRQHNARFRFWTIGRQIILWTESCFLCGLLLHNRRFFHIGLYNHANQKRLIGTMVPGVAHRGQPQIEM